MSDKDRRKKDARTKTRRSTHARGGSERKKVNPTESQRQSTKQAPDTVPKGEARMKKRPRVEIIEQVWTRLHSVRKSGSPISGTSSAG